jgi:hypothetical protein
MCQYSARLQAGRPGLDSRHHVQIGYGAHPASYPMGTGDCLPEGKAAGA